MKLKISIQLDESEDSATYQFVCSEGKKHELNTTDCGHVIVSGIASGKAEVKVPAKKGKK